MDYTEVTRDFIVRVRRNQSQQVWPEVSWKSEEFQDASLEVGPHKFTWDYYLTPCHIPRVGLLLPTEAGRQKGWDKQ